MASERIPIACLGAGRMGRGIAVHFAYAGHDVVLLDLKPRGAEDFAKLATAATKEVRDTLAMLADLGLGEAAQVDAIAARVRVVPASDAGLAARLRVVFEGVPEILDLKREALAEPAAHMAPDAILASTTSTIMVDDLSRRRAEPRTLSQRALAQPGLSRAAGRDLAGHAHRRRDRAAEGAAGRHRQGAGGCAPPPASSSRASRRWR